MRYSVAEKREIIRLVEGSDLGVRRTLAELDVSRSSFYRWYKAYQERGAVGLADPLPRQRRFWNRIPESEREKVVETALAKPELTPRELAWRITDHEGYFISESSVYRILKAYDLVTSPAYVLISAKDRFDHPSRRVNELWQTDFTYFKVVGWGWYYLLTVLDDYSRYIVGWKLFTGMSTNDVEVVLDEVIGKTGVEQVEVRHRPRLLTDNGPCFVSRQLREYLEQKEMRHTLSSHDPGEDRALPPLAEERDQARELLSTVGAGTRDRALRPLLQPGAGSRGAGQPDAGRCLPGPGAGDPDGSRETQAADTASQTAL
jgi:transposase InsO family protein